MIDLYRINLNLLVALDILLAEGSVTRAANKLFLTQAAMSNNLQQLREVFKDELLIRDKNRMVPTSYAISLQPRLHEVLEQLRSVILAGQSFCPKVSQRIFKLAISDYLSSLILPKLLHIFELEAPHLRVMVIPFKYAGMIDNLDQGDIDLMIGKLETRQLDAEKELLFTDQVVCILNPKHALAKQKSLSLDDYLSHDHVALKTAPCETPTLVEEALRPFNATRKIKFATSFMNPMFEIVQASSHLLGTVPATVAKIHEHHYQFVTKPLPFPMPEIEFYLIWHQRHNNDLGHIWLREQLKKITADV